MRKYYCIYVDGVRVEMIPAYGDEDAIDMAYHYYPDVNFYVTRIENI